MEGWPWRAPLKDSPILLTVFDEEGPGGQLDKKSPKNKRRMSRLSSSQKSSRSWDLHAIQAYSSEQETKPEVYREETG